MYDKLQFVGFSSLRTRFSPKAAEFKIHPDGTSFSRVWTLPEGRTDKLKHVVH
jgi:hypothetical protein